MNGDGIARRHAGNHGVNNHACTWGNTEENATRRMRAWRFIAGLAMAIAARALDRYALATDTPELGVVEAADWLSSARDALDRSP